MNKIILKEELKKSQLLMPCIFDAMSAKAAEECGFKVAMISGNAVSYSMSGLPDMAMLSVDELVRATERSDSATNIAITVDFDDGYGESPAVVYKNAQRLIQAGAQALQLEDSTGVRGFERKLAQKAGMYDDYMEPIVSREVWLAKIKAAVAACEGTNCFVIARTNCAPTMGMEEALERTVRAREAGAECTTILGGVMRDLSCGELVDQFDKGLKMWPDIFSVDGKPLVDLAEVDKLGFHLVSCHVFEKGAVYGYAKAASEALKSGNLSYVRSNMCK